MKNVMVFLALLLTVVCESAFAQNSGQGFVTNYLRLQPTTLPSKCRVGDLRFNASTNFLSTCASSNTWSDIVFSSVAPMTTFGDMLFEDVGSSPARLPGNTTSTKQFLTQTGTGVISAAPVWAGILAADVPTLNQNTTGTASNITGIAAILNGGTGQTTANAGFNALSPMSASGDIIYGGAAGAATRLAKGSDGQVLKLVSGLPTWGAGGSGAGPSYILNGDAEINTTGWATYADAAGASPVDGTGGAPVTTFTRTTTAPLSGVGSFLLTKDAANRQGEGASYDFTVDNGDKARMESIQFDYSINSGTYADGDVTVWIYDTTNAQLIQPAPSTLQNITGAGHFKAVFQTASTSTGYRIIFHVSSTSASAYTIKLDNIQVGPQQIVYGSPVTDWQTYTPTFAGFGTVTCSSCGQWRRVGDSMQIRVVFTDGTVTAATAKASLPSGYTFANTSASNELVGYLTIGTGTSASAYTVIAVNSDTTDLQFGRLNGTDSGLSPALGNGIFPSGAVISFFAQVPITGWASNVQMSNDADTRVVTARATISGTVASDTATPINFASVTYDTHGAVTTGTWKYTAPVPGKYRITVGAQLDALRDLYIYKNGVQGAIITTPDSTNLWAYGSDEIDLKAGDYIDIRAGAATNISNTARTKIVVTRISGLSAIAASETVSVIYTSTSVASAGVATPVVYETKVKDTHGAWTGNNTFTAPESGLYAVKAQFYVSGTPTIRLYKNGVFLAQGSVGSTSNVSSGIWEVPLLTGETLDIRPDATYTMGNTATTARLSITRIGNY